MHWMVDDAWHARYLSDWEEFSNSSHLAYDACSGIDIWDPPTGVQVCKCCYFLLIFFLVLATVVLDGCWILCRINQQPKMSSSVFWPT